MNAHPARIARRDAFAAISGRHAPALLFLNDGIDYQRRGIDLPTVGD
jgi:hypothetical protein